MKVTTLKADDIRHTIALLVLYYFLERTKQTVFWVWSFWSLKDYLPLILTVTDITFNKALNSMKHFGVNAACLCLTQAFVWKMKDNLLNGNLYIATP